MNLFEDLSKLAILVLFILAVAFTFSGCDDPYYYGWNNFPYNSGFDSGNGGPNDDEEYCPIPVPTPDPGDDGGDGDGDSGDDDSGDEGDGGSNDDGGEGDGDGGDVGHPSNGENCEVNEYTVCHFPRGNPDNYFTICVGSEAALEAHLNHGDLEGPCEE